MRLKKYFDIENSYCKKLPYRGIGTGILRALALVPDLKLETDYDRNLFMARVARKAE